MIHIIKSIIEDKMLSTNQFKKLAYTGSLSFLGSLITTYSGIYYGFLREVNPVVKVLFKINFFLPLVVGSFIVIGISYPAYKVNSIKNVSRVTVYGIIACGLVFFINFLRELVLFVGYLV